MADPVIFTRRGQEQAREIWTGVPVSKCSPDDLKRAEVAGYEPDGEYFVGRDPRSMTQDEIKLIGHQPMSLMQAIRAKCLDCCAGSSDEVRKCVAMTCPSWPYRAGKNPWRAPPSEGRREAGRRLAAKRAAAASESKSNLNGDDESDGSGQG